MRLRMRRRLGRKRGVEDKVGGERKRKRSEIRDKRKKR